jgi:hypothetical protein
MISCCITSSNLFNERATVALNTVVAPLQQSTVGLVFTYIESDYSTYLSSIMHYYDVMDVLDAVKYYVGLHEMALLRHRIAFRRQMHLQSLVRL